MPRQLTWADTADGSGSGDSSAPARASKTATEGADATASAGAVSTGGQPTQSDDKVRLAAATRHVGVAHCLFGTIRFQTEVRGVKGAVSITKGDRARLNAGELLNDSVIDCFLKCE